LRCGQAAHLLQHTSRASNIGRAGEKLLVERALGTGQDAGQPGGFERGELLRPLAEVGARRGVGAADAGSPVHRVQVQGEDRALAERAFHLHRVKQLAQLACAGAFAAGEERPRQLLGDRAGAAAQSVLVDRRQHAGDLRAVESLVLVKALVFGSQHRRGEQRARLCRTDPAASAWSHVSQAR